MLVQNEVQQKYHIALAFGLVLIGSAILPRLLRGRGHYLKDPSAGSSVTRGRCEK